MFPIINFPTNKPANQNGKLYLFDFAKGDFVTVDGKLVEIEKYDAVKVWIEKAIRTERFKFKVYQTGEVDEYGISLIDFISNNYPFDFVKVEIEREIKETLLKNVEITNVYNFVFTREKRKLVCEFTTDTIYGQVESAVKI